ncbi:hypothetical protein R84B8_01060 [Treponema sp. R8-4-B8]
MLPIKEVLLPRESQNNSLEWPSKRVSDVITCVFVRNGTLLRPSPKVVSSSNRTPIADFTDEVF